MRALITGGAGFIGSALARHLLESGAEVRILDNFMNGFEENVSQNAELIRGDLRDLETVRASCRNIDVVFHQAALRSVPRSVEDPVLTVECNVNGTVNLLMAAEESNVRRLVYAASSSVYGDTNGSINREDMKPAPLSPYAASKLAAEHYCKIWTDLKGLSTVSLRYFNVFGPGQHPDSKYAALFPAFAQALTEGKAPEVHWDGEQSRNFTFIDDVVRANVLAAHSEKAVHGEVFNIGGGSSRTVNEVLLSVSNAVGNWIDPIYQPKRQGDIRHSNADITKARKFLSWEPRADWNESVASTVRWFVEDRRRVYA